MRAFQAPLSRHGWCQLWCTDARNHLASWKLNWRTPTERLTGNTPDISVFRFHFWQHIEFYDHKIKQPGDGWMPGRFLGIARESGDSMTYYVETEKSPRSGRNTILIRSTVRPWQFTTSVSPIAPSGETLVVNDHNQYASLTLSNNKDANDDIGHPTENDPNNNHEDIDQQHKSMIDHSLNWHQTMQQLRTNNLSTQCIRTMMGWTSTNFAITDGTTAPSYLKYN